MANHASRQTFVCVIRDVGPTRRSRASFICGIHATSIVVFGPRREAKEFNIPKAAGDWLAKHRLSSAAFEVQYARPLPRSEASHG